MVDSCTADKGHWVSTGACLVNEGKYESGFDCFDRALSNLVSSESKQRSIDPVQASKWTKDEIESLVA